MTQLLVLAGIESGIALMGLTLAFLGRRRDSRALRARILQYTGHDS